MFSAIPMLVVIIIIFFFVASNYPITKKGNHWKRGDKVGKERECSLCTIGPWEQQLPCVVI
jgi:hypothetical protein